MGPNSKLASPQRNSVFAAPFRLYAFPSLLPSTNFRIYGGGGQRPSRPTAPAATTATRTPASPPPPQHSSPRPPPRPASASPAPAHPHPTPRSTKTPPALE